MTKLKVRSTKPGSADTDWSYEFEVQQLDPPTIGLERHARVEQIGWTVVNIGQPSRPTAATSSIQSWEPVVYFRLSWDMEWSRYSGPFELNGADEHSLVVAAEAPGHGFARSEDVSHTIAAVLPLPTPAYDLDRWVGGAKLRSKNMYSASAEAIGDFL